MKLKKTSGIVLFLIGVLFLNSYQISFSQESQSSIPTFNTFRKTFVKVELEDGLFDNNQIEVISVDKAFGQKVVKQKDGATGDRGVSFSVTSSRNGPGKLWIRYRVEERESARISFSLSNGKSKTKGLPFGEEGKFQWAVFELVTLTAGKPIIIKLAPDNSRILLDTVCLTSDSYFLPTDNEENFIEKITADLLISPYETSTITPKQEHPRLLFTKKDISRIKENFIASENQTIYQNFLNLVDQEVSGILEGGEHNYNDKILDSIEAKAFDYAVNGAKEHGAEAINAILNYLESFSWMNVQDHDRILGHVIFTAAQVYDWCYDLLSDEQKLLMIYRCETIAKDMSSLWPPSGGDGSVVGYNSEAMILLHQLGFGIAVYDERPDIYEYVSGLVLTEHMAFREYWYTSHAHYQGSLYGMIRFSFDLWAEYMFRTACDESVLTLDAQYVPYHFIYSMTPDGRFLTEGDSSNPSTLNLTKIVNIEEYHAAFLLGSSLYEDSVLKTVFSFLNPEYKYHPTPFHTNTPTQFLIINNPDLEQTSLDILPKTKYFGSPKGQMIARTGWDFGFNSPTVMAYMNIGEKYTANHQHLDAGTFQLYYKGTLARDSGRYAGYGSAHDFNYYKETISHNGLLILDPSEIPLQSKVNSGGQSRKTTLVRSLNDFEDEKTTIGKVLGWEFGPDYMNPEYSYISGDITSAYTSKVSEVRRSMMFMPTNSNETPAVFFVMDKITAANKDYKKTFLLHSMQEPTVEGNTTIIKRDTAGFNGKLTNQTLYPKNPVITKIGGAGNQWQVNGVNQGTALSLEDGWGRVEISPTEKKQTDYFLNVMYVGDADKEESVKEAKTIETEELLGAKIENKVTLFVKNKTRAAQELRFQIEGEEEQDIAVCGIEKGEWIITRNGQEITKEIATEEGGMIYFSAQGGEFVLNLSNPFAKKETPNFEVTQKEKPVTNLIFDGKPLYHKDTIYHNGKEWMISARSLFGELGYDVAWNEEESCALFQGEKHTIKIPLDSETVWVDEKLVQLSSKTESVKGFLMVPESFLAEHFNYSYQYYPNSNTIIATCDKIISAEQVVKIVDATWSSAATTGLRAFDDDPTSNWAAEGSGQWIRFEFNEPSKIYDFSIKFFSMIDRVYSFELYASNDDVNYTKVFDGKTTLTLKDSLFFQLSEPIEAKYIKLVGHGSDLTPWTTLGDIKFFKE